MLADRVSGETPRPSQTPSEAYIQIVIILLLVIQIQQSTVYIISYSIILYFRGIKDIKRLPSPLTAVRNAGLPRDKIHFFPYLIRNYGFSLFTILGFHFTQCHYGLLSLSHPDNSVPALGLRLLMVTGTRIVSCLMHVAEAKQAIACLLCLSICDCC